MEAYDILDPLIEEGRLAWSSREPFIISILLLLERWFQSLFEHVLSMFQYNSD
jgi:hypothetical protein